MSNFEKVKELFIIEHYQSTHNEPEGKESNVNETPINKEPIYERMYNTTMNKINENRENSRCPTKVSYAPKIMLTSKHENIRLKRPKKRARGVLAILARYSGNATL